MDNTLVPCFVCGKELENIGRNQPLEGTEFSTYGHYGSGVFDPMDGSELAINICNTCLLDGVNRGRALLMRVTAFNDSLEIFELPVIKK